MPNLPYRFVFLVRIKEGSTEQEYIEAWRDGSAVIQEEPGALGTKLYRVSPGVLLAMALWESEKDRVASAKKLGRIDDATSDPNSVTNRHKQFGNAFILEEVASVDPPSA